MIALITTEQYNDIVGKEFSDGSFFNPIQDLNNNWVISIEEIEGTTKDEFMWVKDLELSEYQPKPINKKFS